MGKMEVCQLCFGLLSRCMVGEHNIKLLHSFSMKNRKLEEAGSVAVLPPRCGPLSPGSIPGPGAVCHLISSPNLLPRVFLRVLQFSSCKTGLLSTDCILQTVTKTIQQENRILTTFSG